MSLKLKPTRVFQQELFPIPPKRERILFERSPERSAKVSSLVNKYDAKLMLALERAQKIDGLREVLKDLKSLKKRAGFSKRNYLRREVRAFFARLERLGISRDEINAMLKKRVLAVSMLERDIDSKIKELCDTPERQLKLSEALSKVKGWSGLVNSELEAKLHALVELRRMQLNGEW